LNALENVKLELSDLSGCPGQQLCLKVLSASTLLPELLSAFKQEYPAISFSLIQNTQNEDFDLCIYSLPSALDHSEGTLLMDEEILIAVPKSSIAAANTSVSLHDLADEDFISLSRETVFRSITDYYCKKLTSIPISSLKVITRVLSADQLVLVLALHSGLRVPGELSGTTP